MTALPLFRVEETYTTTKTGQTVITGEWAFQSHAAAAKHYAWLRRTRPTAYAYGEPLHLSLLDPQGNDVTADADLYLLAAQLHANGECVLGCASCAEAMWAPKLLTGTAMYGRLPLDRGTE